MTLHPTRLAVLISFMGVGVSATANVMAPHASARAEMARMLDALALDAAEHAAAASAGRREPSGGRLHQPPAFLDPSTTGSDVPRAEAIHAPPVPGPLPDAPADPRVVAGPTARPIDEQEDSGPLESLPAGGDGARSRPKSDQDNTAAASADVFEGPTDGGQSSEVPFEVADDRPASADQIDTRAAISPTEHVLNDLAASRGKPETEEPEPARAPWDGETVAIDASRLDGVRGGFVAHTGLKLSFGIERAVYINGTLVTTTALNVSDLSKLSAGQATFASLNGGTLAVLQSGTGNTFLPGAVSASTIGTVIQNTLDNQNIQSVTTINATVNSGEIVRSLNLQQSVQSAITFSRR